MTFLKKLTNNYSIVPFQQHRFYEHPSCLSYHFTRLEFWQLLEMKKFALKTPLVLLKEYGFNGETRKGNGTLNISRLKEWTKTELKDLEEILGKGIVNFLSVAA
jgi:hypothetical protein